MTIQDGGAAFPAQNLQYGTNGIIICESHQVGMSLRDWFAGQALIGLISIAKDICDSNDVESISKEEFAENSYRYADAMLAQRTKP